MFYFIRLLNLQMQNGPHNAKYSSKPLPQSSDEVLALVQWRRREEVIGKEVIDGDARKLGITKDLAWSDDGRLALVIESSDEEESFLSFNEIEKIGDVVFVKAKSALVIAPTVTCPVCKHKNLIEAKFCAKCGRTLESKEEKKEKKRSASEHA
jgi:sporulation protein YlmC with PRC-barrel domain